VIELFIDVAPNDEPIFISPVLLPPIFIVPVVVVLYKNTLFPTATSCIVFVSREDVDNLPVEALNVKFGFVLIFDDPDAVDENVMYPSVSVVLGVNVIAVALAIVPVSGA